jgi:exodeoxyribonuclease V beta subunit
MAKDEAKAAAADATAAEIAHLLAEAGAGRITLDGRALRAGDIAVLVRSHAQGGLMRQALAAAGVASVELSQASVFHSADAEELQRVLAALLEPTRDGLLKAALATRWLGFDAAALQALAGDEAALMAQMQRSSGYHALWRARGLGFMLRHWLHAEGVPQRLLAQPDGPRRLTNLLHLAEQLHQASAELAAPEALLRWLQAQRDDPRGDEASQLRLESDQNLVQIVTIHKSKGLEYPLVFCPLLWDGRAPPAADGLDGVARHDADGMPVVDFRRGLDADFDDAAAKAEARLEAAAEGLRLVYVALTRAVQRCYLVVGSYRNRAGRGWSVAESGRSLLNWLVAGTAQAPADWLKQGADPAAVAAAWQALADADADAGAGMALAPLPIGRAAARLDAAADDAPLQALPPPAHLSAGWWIGSYSALAHGSAHERAAADHDLRADTAEASAADAVAAPLAALVATATLPPDDILRFPRGPAAGECVHAVFELADFTAPTGWPAAITQALQSHGLAAPPSPGAPPLPAMLATMLADVLATPLPLGTAQPLRLATLAPARRLAELEFHLHAPQLTAAALNALLARHGLAVPRLAFGALHGYLKGFIDLVFEHDGRYFVADWKSNHLGDGAAHYAGPALAAAMATQGYHLQALIYGLALHRWLQQRLPGYGHARHFGGAAYLFVRGLRPGWRQADGKPTGLHFQRPSQALLDELSALLDGNLTEPQTA